MNELVSDLQLTAHERIVVAACRNPSTTMRRALRLSIQYVIGAACFVVAAIVTENAWWSVPVYLTLVASTAIRLMHARRLAAVWPSIIAKYEKQITDLKATIAHSS